MVHHVWPFTRGLQGEVRLGRLPLRKHNIIVFHTINIIYICFAVVVYPTIYILSPNAPKEPGFTSWSLTCILSSMVRWRMLHLLAIHRKASRRITSLTSRVRSITAVGEHKYKLTTSIPHAYHNSERLIIMLVTDTVFHNQCWEYSLVPGRFQFSMFIEKYGEWPGTRLVWTRNMFHGSQFTAAG